MGSLRRFVSLLSVQATCTWAVAVATCEEASCDSHVEEDVAMLQTAQSKAALSSQQTQAQAQSINNKDKKIPSSSSSSSRSSSSTHRTSSPKRRRGTDSICPAPVDFIVVGGGGGGCGAAAALVDQGHSVIVFERGVSDLEPSMASTQAASGWPKSVVDGGEVIRWESGVWGIVGNVLGGGTALNGGLFFEDLPSWFETALPGVDLARMKTSYEVLNSTLTTPSQPTAFGLAWNEALQQAGFPAADLDHSKLQIVTDRPFVGQSTFNLTQAGGPRKGAAYLLHMRADKPNLQVFTSSPVQKVLLDGKKAIGVQVSVAQEVNGQTVIENCQALARKGVIVSAGAVYTPKLLQLSGIGPKEWLDEIGVEVVADLPVGKNFTDRLVQAVGALSPTEIDLTIGYTVMADTAHEQVIEGVGGGKISQMLAIASVGLAPPKCREDYLRTLLKLAFDITPQFILDIINRMSQTVALQTDTHSRGYVRAASSDPADQPKVDPNTWSDPRDLPSQVARFKELLMIRQQPAMAKYRLDKLSLPDSFHELLEDWVPEILPAMSCLFKKESANELTDILVPCLEQTSDMDESMKKYVMDYLVSSYHYFGTAGAGAVVEQHDFSVKGMQNLYVADASVIPIPTTVNPQGTIMSLGHYIGTLLR